MYFDNLLFDKSMGNGKINKKKIILIKIKIPIFSYENEYMNLQNAALIFTIFIGIFFVYSFDYIIILFKEWGII